MGYRTLRQCVDDLERTGQLVRLDQEVDADLEAAEIQHRVYASGGPAVFYPRVKGCRFPMVSNLFGTTDRVRFIFRDSLQAVRRLIELKTEPNQFWRKPARYLGVPRTGLTTFPKSVPRGPVLDNETSIDQLPPLKSWPDDGGPFITLPIVYTEHAEQPGWRGSNLGMYRVQLSGGDYELNREIGLHYQIHRGIGIHHAIALSRNQPLRVNVFVGGSPAMAVAAVMPLPEGMTELIFAGALARHRIPLVTLPGQIPIYAQADFCICGELVPDCVKQEGPFGDHLGYYSLRHPFPVMKVHRVYHRDGAIWPFTVVGRPPQEDTSFGKLIHELTAPIVPTVVPGVHAVNAVDAAGVHPLLLAIGSERYVPFQERRRPQELLTQASAILGQGQMSLAKYLLIVAREDNPQLDIHNLETYWCHLLARVDWRRSLHFHTETTIDTLDYSSPRLNEGSKLVIAASGPATRELISEIPSSLHLPDGFGDAQVCLPGVLAVRGPAFSADEHGRDNAVPAFCEALNKDAPINRFPLVVVVDDSQFTARNLENFHWITFTRSNPAADVHGIGASTHQKHYGCTGSLVIDARIKPHHAPPLVEDRQVTAKIDALAARGGPLAAYL